MPWSKWYVVRPTILKVLSSVNEIDQSQSKSGLILKGRRAEIFSEFCPPPILRFEETFTKQCMVHQKDSFYERNMQEYSTRFASV